MLTVPKLQGQQDILIFNKQGMNGLSNSGANKGVAGIHSDFEGKELEDQRAIALGNIFQEGFDLDRILHFGASIFPVGSMPVTYVSQRCMPVIASELKEFGAKLREEFSHAHIDDIAVMAREYQLSLKYESDKIKTDRKGGERDFNCSSEKMVEVTENCKPKTKSDILVCFNEIKRCMVEQELFIVEQNRRSNVNSASPFLDENHLKKTLGSYTALVGEWECSFDRYKNISLNLEIPAALFTSEPKRMQTYLIERTGNDYKREYQSMRSEIGVRSLGSNDSSLLSRLDECFRRDFLSKICAKPTGFRRDFL